MALLKGHGTTTAPNNYTYIDKLIDAGKYFYCSQANRLRREVLVLTKSRNKLEPGLTAYKLEQNYPNPFNPTTTIGFGIPEKGNVRLSILNILGEEIRVLLNEEKVSGYHSVDFSASELPSGVYFYQLKVGNSIDTKKMILIR